MGRLSEWADDGTRERIHGRIVETTNYPFDDSHILSVGRLTDTRYAPSFGFTGRPHEAGPLHDFELYLLLHTPDLAIEDIEVKILTVPRPDCEALAHSLDAVIGLTISKGFTGRVKSLAGGRDGCTHLVHLLTTMAPAILQGYWALVDRKRPASEEVGRRRAAASAKYLRDSCFTWREGGESYRELLDLALGTEEAAT